MRICTVEGCQREHVARGLCGNHYQKARAAGEITDIRPLGRIGCEAEGCEGSHYARGCCKRHYERLMRTGSIEAAYTPPALPRLEQLREQRGWTRGKLAVHAAIDPATLSRIMKGVGNPNLETLRKLAGAVGVRVVDIIDE